MRLASFAELARFGAVGVASTALYGALALALTGLGWRAAPASVLAYAVATACSYLGHKIFTFGVAGDARQASKFLAVSATGFAIASLLPPAAVALGLGAHWGVGAVCVAIPLANYFALKRLVFARGAAAA